MAPEPKIRSGAGAPCQVCGCVWYCNIQAHEQAAVQATKANIAALVAAHAKLKRFLEAKGLLAEFEAWEGS